jgi:putative thioredoxin
MSAAAYVLEGTEYNFDRLVIENSRKGLVLVDFWAPWAGPSLRQQKVLRELAEQYGGRFLLVTVNTDEQKGIAGRFAVKSLPSFKLFRHGRVVEEFHGMQPEADYRAIVDRYLVPLGDKARLAAARAWNAGEHDKAIQVLAEGAMAEPENLEIPAMLAKLLMRLERFDAAREVLAAMPEEARDTPELATLRAHLDFIVSARAVDDEAQVRARLVQTPPDLAAHFQAAALDLVNDRYEAALQSLIVILRADRDFDGGAARRGLLAIFDTLGSDHELVRRYRGELARLIH